MTSLPSTTRIVPAWIRDQVARYERAWPLGVLSACVAVAVLLDISLGVLLWTADSVVFYARP